MTPERLDAINRLAFLGAFLIVHRLHLTLVLPDAPALGVARRGDPAREVRRLILGACS